MTNEREKKLTVKKPLSNSTPKTSADTQTTLTSKDYNISGNEFTAYYDGAHKLVFVLDKTLDERKPNVLLVVNPIGDRKWDDILANDFGVDLETIRPKVDNKYQKLDIEYSGLAVYDNLINDSTNNVDLTSALAELSDFRNSSIRRAAADRLAASLETITKTRETISKTGETMRELQSRLKKLRDKLSRQKKEVGKEPTKQSAAKILKTESQIDNMIEKLRRAKRRLKNAQRRLAIAEEDAEIARRILNNKELITKKVKDEPKAKEMAEDVKPLFDQDPKILDNGIAFKPIDFSITTKSEPEPVIIPETKPIVIKPVVDVRVEPIAFVPPVMNNTYTEEQKPAIVIPVPAEPVIVHEQPKPVPVLNTMTPVPMPQPVSAPEIRPVSPISGPEQLSINGQKRPTALYYVMLVVLIVLSVFTLWLYQNKTGNNIVPELSTSAKPEMVFEQPETVVEPASVPETTESPFIQAERVEQPATIVEESAPVPEAAAPVVVDNQEQTLEVIIEPEAAPVQQIVQPQPSYVDESVNNMVQEEQPADFVPAPESDMIVNKPAYNVSGERVFVADENYQGVSDNMNNSQYSE